MTDLEICKAVAEIVGIKYKIDAAMESVAVCRGDLVPSGTSITSLQTFDEIYNPLTDDALCFRLMVKHSIEFSPSWQEVRSDGRKPYGAYKVGGDQIFRRSDSPNKAICMAIIEANK